VSNFAENLRKAIFNKRCKAVDVSRGTNIRPSVISRYLSGTNQPSAGNLFAIAEYLGVSPNTLLSSSDAPESSETSRHISSDKDKIIDVQDKLIQSLQKQTISQSHYINALFKELGEAKIKTKEWEDWKASSKERHAKGKAKADLAIAKNKNTTTRKRKK
jgi:transcriptional regulator with XRE-family HTH domain